MDDLLLPPRYKVVLSDDKTISEDVAGMLLVQFFDKSIKEAGELVDTVSREGSAAIGTYVKEVAEAKIAAVADWAGRAGFSLRLSMTKV